MGLLQRRRIIVQEHGVFYGGIKCMIDNASWSGNGKISEYNSNKPSLFLSEYIPLTPGRIEFGTQGTTYGTAPGAMRLFYTMDKTEISYNYWSPVQNPRSFSINTPSYGVFNVPKDKSEYFYVKNNTTGKYLLKGSAVVE